MILSHRIALITNETQETFFKKACGCRRFAWNWGVAEWGRQYRAGEKSDGRKLRTEFNAIKGEQFPWTYESPKDATHRPFQDLQHSYSNYFKFLAAWKKKGCKGRRPGRPGFKKRGKCRESFYLCNDQFKIEDKQIRIPLLGWITLTEPLRFNGKILNATVSRTADMWFIAIQVDMGKDYHRTRSENQALGIDMGINHAMVITNGTKFKVKDAPKPLKFFLKKLARLQRQLSRKQPGSSNRRKAQVRVARLHAQIANIRLDWLHKTTTGIVRHANFIAVEDLGIGGMVQNHKLARTILDIGWGEAGRQLKYKSEIYQSVLQEVGRFYPSSKRCNDCGRVRKHLGLSNRTFVCKCGNENDRDRNASLNILDEGMRLYNNKRTVGYTGTKTPVDSGPLHRTLVQCKTTGRNRND
jgi:putative transposase